MQSLIYLVVVLARCTFAYVFAWQAGVNGTDGTIMQYQPTIDYVASALNKSIDLLPVADSAELIRAAQNGSADFVVTSATAFQCIQISNQTTPIASLLQFADGQPVASNAGLILSRPGSNITRYQDIKGKIVSAGQLTGLITCQAQWGALQAAGVSLFGDTKAVFLSTDPQQPLRHLLDNTADVAFINPVYYHSLLQQGAMPMLQVVSPMHLPGYPYEASTPMYPGLVLSALPTINYSVANRVSQTLLGLSPSSEPLTLGGYPGWTTPLSYIRTLALELDIGIIQFGNTTCSDLSDVYNAIKCKKGEQKLQARSVQSSCRMQGVQCPFNSTCICTPCVPIPDRRTIGGISSRGFVVMVSTLASVGAVVACIAAFLILQWRRLHVNFIQWQDLQVAEDDVVGTSMYGPVIKGVYQGTPITVKRAYPCREPMKSTADSTLCFVALSTHARNTAHDLLECFGIRTQRQQRIRAVWKRAMMRHSNIVPTLGVCRGGDGDEILMINLFMDRGTLYDLIHNPSIAIDDVLGSSIARDIALAMAWLHSHDPPITGYNLRSHHIMLDSNYRAHLGGTLSDVSTKKSVVMAPELLAGGAISKATDVYAYGMLLYSVLARAEPFEGEDAIQVMQAVVDATADEIKRPQINKLNVDGAMIALMQSCWANDPMARPNFSDICSTLARYGKQTLADNLIQEVQRGKALLHKILPPRVSRALQEGRAVEPEYYDQCTLYFSDVVGFTNISSVLQADEVMHMLNDLYTRLDAVAQEHDMFKVETIGDAYMACSNLHVTQADHAARAARFALAATAAAAEVVMPGTVDKRLVIRVGLHSGPVAASVIGTTNPRYCLFGDTINVASRMESTSEPGRIQMTVPTARLVQKQDNSLSYRLKRRAGAIEVKGKGVMQTWWLLTDADLVQRFIAGINTEASPGSLADSTPQIWTRARRLST